MEAYIYLSLVVFLFLLAISDLVVGVSNDAVNFLNSAIGAKVAPFKVIMFIAALGILVGATFSSGMMEVARKGIMHPSQFYFTEIMVIFFGGNDNRCNPFGFVQHFWVSHLNNRFDCV